jgi:hypothetical protein
MRKLLIIFSIFLAGTAQLFAQNSVFDADKWFDNFEFAKAARIYEQNLGLKKLNKERLEKLTYSHLRLGNNERGLALVDSLIELHNDEYEFWLWKSYFHKELGQYNSALTAIDTYEKLGGPDETNFFRANCTFLLSNPESYEGELKLNDFNDVYANSATGNFQGKRVLLTEVGIDSTGAKFGFADNDIRFAEIMLLRPFIIEQNERTPLFTLPEGFALHSINSFVLDDKSSQVMFSSNIPVGPNRKDKAFRIYQAQFNGVGYPLTNIEGLFEKEWLDTVSIGHVAMDNSKSTLVFTLSGTKKTDADFYVTYKDNGSWTTPENLTGINTAGDEMYPIFDDNAFYFSSNGRPGYGGLDIYQTTIVSTRPLAFSEVNILPAPVNSSKDDFLLFHLGKDTLCFSSNRPGGIGDDDSWMFIFPPAPVEPEDPFNLEEFAQTWDLKRIYFDFDLSISDDDLTFVLPLVEAMGKVPQMEIKLVGHTDSRGTKTYNYNLGMNRAEWVKERLTQKGIDANRIQIESVGANELVNGCTPEIFWCTETQHRANRFVQIHLAY